MGKRAYLACLLFQVLLTSLVTLVTTCHSGLLVGFFGVLVLVFLGPGA